MNSKEALPLFLVIFSHERSLAPHTGLFKSYNHGLATCCSVSQAVFATPWIAAHQVSLSITVFQSLLKLMSIESFFLELFLHSSPVTYWTPTDLGGLIFQCHIYLPFHTVCGVLEAGILKWFAIPFSSGTQFVRTLCHDLSLLGGPARLVS